MKKLFLFSVLGFFALSANAQLTITSPAAAWCCGSSPTVYVSYFGPTPVSSSWQLFHSNSDGEYDNSVFSTTTSGLPPSFYFWSSTSYTTCGEYYYVRVGVTTDGINWTYTGKNLYYSPNPTPAITGSAGCGYGSYSATPTGTGYSYAWSASYNNSPVSYVYPSGSNCGVGIGNFNKVNVTVTDPNGCSGQTSLNVTNTNPNIDPAFTITRTSYGPTDQYYYITITRSGSYSLTGVTDLFQIQDLSTGAPMSHNDCWTSGTPNWSSQIFLFGYDGPSFFTYTNNCSASIPGYVHGRLDKNHTYYIEHYVWLNGCLKILGHQFDYTNGFTTRMAGGSNADTISATTAGFDVFPNPNNGSFTVQLSNAAENAQAELFNLMGERVDAFTISGTSYNYTPTTTIASGVYFLRISSNGTTTSQRIVIE